MIYQACKTCGHSCLRCQHFYAQAHEGHEPRQCKSVALPFSIHCFRHASAADRKKAIARQCAEKTKAPK